MSISTTMITNKNQAFWIVKTGIEHEEPQLAYFSLFWAENSCFHSPN